MSAFTEFLTSPQPGEEVIISGISGKFPGSSDMYDFKEKLFNKKDMVGDTSKRYHFDSEDIPKRGGTIDNIDKFDPGFFGIHHRQAHNMDPMLRVFLETATEAIFDAGLNPSELENSKTGIYLGISWEDCLSLAADKEPHTSAVLGYLKIFVAHRMAYFLKLRGPCFTTDTACSSSLNALECAFKDLRNGRCDKALVGCAHLTLYPGTTLQFYRLGVLGLDGKCKVFDEEANGYVRSETIACILLEKAKDSRRIYAQVVYTKINSDGFKEDGITFPSAEMQSELMKEVYAESGVNPNDLCYLEGHLTGTRVGDPQEIAAIDNVVGRKRNKPLWIGSVKSNLGHAEPGSGMCSIAKVIVAMETGLIPPNIHLKTIKKSLVGIVEGRLKPVVDITPLGEGDFIGINNFGFGGNNCHSILKRISVKRVLKNDGLPRLICVSGRTKEAVLKIFQDLGQRELNYEFVRLLQEVFKFDISGHIYRGYAIVSDKKPLTISVSRVSSKVESFQIRFGDFYSYYKVIGKSLMEISSFKQSLTRFNHELKERNLDIFEIILKGKTDFCLDILGSVAVQIAIYDTIKMLKLEIESINGDSWGKLPLLYFQGYLNIKQILKIILENGTSSILKMKLENVCDRISPARKSQILDLSNSMISLVNGAEPLAIFLEFIGRLYENGYNPQIQNLYPEVKFPVSRGTPMISPLISWDHSKSWYTALPNAESEKINLNGFRSEVTYNLSTTEHSFIQGHVVGDRNLFPATGYLSLVWKELASRRRLVPKDIGIVFEDVRFLTAATFHKSDYLHLILSVQMDGTFEISQGNVILVKGKATLTSDKTIKNSSTLPARDFHDGGCSLVMDKEDFYKELSLRGYNYRGLFQGVTKAKVDASSGLVKWEDNWIAFMDNMLQLKILQIDTRSLYVPTEIKRCIIIPSKQTTEVNAEVPITVYKDANLIKCEGVEIYGLEAKSIAKKKQANEPIIEKYIFVPNSIKLDLEDSLTVNVQIILENNSSSNFKALELFDDNLDNVESVLPKISKILEGIPLISSDFTVRSKLEPEIIRKDIESVKVEDILLTPKNNYLLIIGYKVLEKLPSSKSIFGCLNKYSFLLTREDKSFAARDVGGVRILTVHTTENEKLILLRKIEEIVDYITIEVASDNFEWLTKLQTALNIPSATKIIIYSQNQSENGILGLMNCILRENGGDRVKCFFILGAAPKFDINDEFYRKQLERDCSINVYKNGKWGTYRHLPLKEIEATENEHCLVDNTVKGDLSSLKWLHGKIDPKSKNIVQVHYSALNFKDVMIATGRISVDTFLRDRLQQEFTLGIEYSGVNLRGKRIMGTLVKGGLATTIETDPDFTWEVPKYWSLEEAATVPTVYCTVIYGLLMRAQLKRGMSVLIHSATGGVGLAAINVCSYYGCEIFVTVGTEEKREFLRRHFPQISNDHIGNSRDTSFEQMIEKETRGRGVDIVLNSLAEEKLLASVRCLARGGSFVEIGKFDLAQNSPLGLLLLEKNATYHGVMLDVLFLVRDQMRNDYLNAAFLRGIELGYVKPLPAMTFGYEKVEDAFRFMASGKHIGKVLVKVRENENDTRKFIVKGLPRVYCNDLNSYVIIGGLGGFGLELADWLVTRGARKLILSTRHGVRNGYQMKRIRIWESYGVSVSISTADISKEEGCLQLIKEAEGLGPVEGIFNLGVVLRDAGFENQTVKDFEISFGPKAFATKFLDEITRKRCHDLRYFVVFSSISCGRGNAGQTNYGMANSVMERVCENRRRDGIPGLAIEWGAIGDVGLVAQLAKNNEELEIRGTLQQRISNCLEILDRLLTQTESAIVSSMVVASKKKSYGSGTAVDAVLRTLGISDVNTVSRHSTLAELGMDSITATEIIQVLETDFDIYLTAKDIRKMTFEEIVKLGEIGSSDPQNKEQELEQHLLTFSPDILPSENPITKMISGLEETKSNESAVVFVLPGFEGSLLSMEPITRNLNCNSFGLKYNFADVDSSIQEMAKCFIPSIEEKLSNDKSFNLICHSFGGHLGIEIAHLLEKKGYNGNIFAIDTGLAYLNQTIDNVYNVESDSEFESVFIYNALNLLIQSDQILSHKEKLKEFGTYEERIKYAHSIALKSVLSQELITDFEQKVTISYKRIRAVRAYNFSQDKLKSRVYLFKASNPIISMANEDYGWAQICQNSINVKEVEGNHSSILNHHDLYETINKILQK